MRVFGNIVFVSNVPGASNLDMEGSAFDLNPDQLVTRRLLNITRNSTGVIRIRAKWHTPIEHGINRFDKLRVTLLKPNDQQAGSLEAFSFHGDATPKVDVTYNVTAQDASQTGDWRIQVRNISSVKLLGFDTEKGIAQPVCA